jgi:hypothetical protein
MTRILDNVPLDISMLDDYIPLTVSRFLKSKWKADYLRYTSEETNKRVCHSLVGGNGVLSSLTATLVL